MNYKDVIAENITFSHYQGAEYRILIPPIIEYRPISDIPDYMPSIILVYQIYREMEDRFIYKFIGAKVD